MKYRRVRISNKIAILLRRAKCARDFCHSSFENRSTWKKIKLLNGSAKNSCVSSLVVDDKVIDDHSEHSFCRQSSINLG